MARNVLIEGWRGISHSYALVNQHQIRALLDRPGINLFHHDLPYFGTNWSRATAGAGFDPAIQARIDAVPALGDRRSDTIYRMGYPPRRYGGNAERVYCFGTLEVIEPPSFYVGPESRGRYTNDRVTIVTPSRWSRDAFLAGGVRPEDVTVVPHGVDPAVFRPLAPEDRERIRRSLGFADDSFVFLNVSAATLNKGIDHLLSAFAIVHAGCPRSRLVLKDMPALYDASARDAIDRFARKFPARAKTLPLRAVTVLSQNLPVERLRDLYGACDAYVAPYRAEGFNLPALEAAACGTPIIVTAGGPTDDYFDPVLGLRVASRRAVDRLRRGCLEPDLDSLVACMGALADGRRGAIDMPRGAALVHARHAWSRVADRLVELL